MNNIIIIFVLLISYSVEQDIFFPLSSEEAEISLSNKVTDLGFDIHKLIQKYYSNLENYVYSPVSIATVLYMLLLGANGKTNFELSQLLGINNTSYSTKPHEEFSGILRNLNSVNKLESVITLANGIFVQNHFPIRQQYKDVITSLYKSEVLNLNFQENPQNATDIINNWVSEKTLGKIKSIISDILPADTQLVVGSSLYFKSDWKYPFHDSLTKLQTFYPNGKQQASNLKINLMANSGTYRYYNDTNLNCEVVGLPYKDKNIFFYLALPYNSNKEKVQELSNVMTHRHLKNISSYASLEEIIVAIPKMKITSDYFLNSVLKNLGLTSIFNPGQSDLSLLTSVERRKKRQSNKSKNLGLYANQFIHKVVVEVNEKGTEGSAATVASTARTAIKIVKADVPFLFFIYHETTEMILFWGSIVAPTS